MITKLKSNCQTMYPALFAMLSEGQPYLNLTAKMEEMRPLAAVSRSLMRRFCCSTCFFSASRSFCKVQVGQNQLS